MSFVVLTIRSFACSLCFVPSGNHLFSSCIWLSRGVMILQDFHIISTLQGPPHKLAVVFVDNSGVDIILGMFPFIRELLSRGTKVMYHFCLPLTWGKSQIQLMITEGMIDVVDD